ncbi:MAG: hypothetical protein ACTHU0_09295 [Kofleriaceae bacterium]
MSFTRVALASALLGLGLAGCAANSDGDAPPTLEITSPQRGTFTSDDAITVTGRVRDEGPVQLSINGTEVVPAADGSFTATIPVAPGIAFLETRAVDRAGQAVRDVRAVLTGDQAPTDGSEPAPIGARAGTEALGKIGDAIATAAEAIDFTAAVKAMNPVYENTGCLGAKIDVTSVALSNIDLALTPKAGAITTAVSIDNVVVKMHANFKVACVGGSTNITVRSSKARIRGDLGVAIRGSKLATSLAGTTVALDGFSIDVGGVPGAIEDLLKNKAREAVENSLTNVIRDRVPPMANDALAGLIARPFDAAILGKQTRIAVAPSAIEVSPSGLFVAVETRLSVEGGEGGTFASTPAPLAPSLLASAAGLGVAVADDAANQLLAGLWAAGAFDLSLPIDAVGPVAALLDDDARTLEVRLSLPPTATTEGAAELAIGDLIVTTRDAAGAEVQRLALSVRTEVSAVPSAGKLALTLGAPEVHAQVLLQSDAVDRPLADEQVEGIVTGVWGLVGNMASDALGKLPMPAVGGVQLGAPTVEGRDGFLVADVGL